MSDISQGLKIPPINMLISSPVNLVGINIQNGQLIPVNGSIDGIPVVSFIGSKDLSRNWGSKRLHKRIVNNKYRPRDPRRTNIVFDRDVSKFEHMALCMSVTLPITKEECEELLLPFMMAGIRFYVMTLANSRNLPNVIDCESRFGFKNKWIASSTPPAKDEEYDFLNKLLRVKKSSVRILTSKMHVRQVFADV